ncbi:emp24p/erv25p- protein, partial [Entomophthora muscae]
MKLSYISFILANSLSLFSGVQGIYFYIQGSDPKCFLENLPPATVVVGYQISTEVFQASKNGYFEDAEVVVAANVKEKDSTTSFVSQKLGYKGQLTFTTTTLGDHHICFSAGVPSGGWFHEEKI